MGSTQGSGAPIISQSKAPSRPAKRYSASSSARRYRYNCRDNINTKDGNNKFFTSPPADKYDEDLIDVEVLEKSNLKTQRRRVGT